eukprot:13099641-Alexandrium_andersonii.AAC.1
MLAQIPNPPTSARIEGVRSRVIVNLKAPICDPPIRKPSDPWLVACESTENTKLLHALEA